MSLSPFLHSINPASECTTLPATLATTYQYPLDHFQQHAIAAISRDENVLVTAKTGSGKTLVGEYQIAHSLAKGRRVFYTTPIKSLSNQKFYDLKKMFPDRVGIMTGDIKFKPDADIVILTTEILRNLLFKQGTRTESVGLTASLSLKDLDAVVFDECHYINDKDRGAVWEETLILLDRSVNLVLLSATIDAPEQFASWLGALKEKPIHLISTQHRVVPLIHGVYREREFLTVMDAKERFDPGTYSAWLLWKTGQKDAATAHRQQVAARRQGGYENGPVARKGGVKSFVAEMNELIGRLDEDGGLPALFFVFSRAHCEKYAAACEHTLLDSSDTAAVKHIIDFHLHRYGDELLQMPQYNTIRGLLEKGIAFHHSGLLPILKEIVEILFSRGFVKLLFATETFAVGINMPTKTVVFTSYRKYDDSVGGMRVLHTDEYIQMAGRAGRRGKDDKGVVLYLPDREPEDMATIKQMLTGARATFQSRMKFHYDFIIKTIQLERIKWSNILKDSYWAVKQERLQAAAVAELDAARAKRGAASMTDAEVAAVKEYEELSERVRTSVNAPRRVAQRALDAWKDRHMGPVWHRLLHETWPQRRALNATIADLEATLEYYSNPERDVFPVLEVLRDIGFINESWTELTTLGTLASEVNEGHTILMPLLYTSRAFDWTEWRAEEIVALLAMFLGDGRDDEEGMAPTTVPARCVAAIMHVRGDMAGKVMDVEKKYRVVSPDTYWNVSSQWVDPVWQLLNGAAMATVCADYGLFEGNCMKALSKMVGLVEEWRVMATLSNDTAMLEKLAGVEERLHVGISGSESLYLRLV